MAKPEPKPDGALELVKSSSNSKAFLLWYTAKISEAEHHRTIDGKPLLRWMDCIPAHVQIRKLLRICMSEQQHNSQAVYRFPLTAEQHVGMMQIVDKFAGEQRTAWGHMLATGWRSDDGEPKPPNAAHYKAERARVEKLLADEEEAQRKRLANPVKPPVVKVQKSLM